MPNKTIEIAFPIDAAGLAAIGVTLFGENWRSPLARALGMSYQQIAQKWQIGEVAIPHTAQLALLFLCEYPEMARQVFATGKPLSGSIRLDSYSGRKALTTSILALIEETVAVDPMAIRPTIAAEPRAKPAPKSPARKPARRARKAKPKPRPKTKARR